MAGRARTAEPPFADHGGAVTGRLQDGADGRRSRQERTLTLEGGIAPDISSFGHLIVVADITVAGVQPGQQRAAGGGADGAAAVVPGEAHPLGGDAVQMGGADLFLAVAAEFATAEVVGEDEDQVGRPRGGTARLQGCGTDGCGGEGGSPLAEEGAAGDRFRHAIPPCGLKNPHRFQDDDAGGDGEDASHGGQEDDIAGQTAVAAHRLGHGIAGDGGG